MKPLLHSCFLILEPCIISMEEMQNHGIELNERSKGKRYVKHDDFIEFKCQSGYTLQDGLSLPDFTVQCNSGNIVYPQCDKGSCSFLEVLFLGDILNW